MIKKIERVLVALVGIFLINFGVGLMPLANIGSDPLTLLFEALAINVGFTIGTWNTILGAIYLVIAFIIDKKKIGFSTVVYVVFGQYIIDGTIDLLPQATNVYMIILYVTLASIGLGLGSALLNTARIGLSYYEAYNFSVSEKIHMKYYVFRYINEVAYVLICILLHHYPNIGTLFYLLTMGPLVDLFIKLIRKPIRTHLGIPINE